MLIGVLTVIALALIVRIIQAALHVRQLGALTRALEIYAQEVRTWQHMLADMGPPTPREGK